MKSKKHDHSLTKWLKGIIFGILILMPVLIFLPNAFYYGFNEQAVAQEKTEQVPVYYQTNEVNSVDDLINGNVYRLTINASYNQVNGNNIINIEKALNFTYEYTTTIFGIYSNVPYILKNSNVLIYTYLNETNTTNTYSFSGNGYIDFVYISHGNISDIIQFISICDYQYIKEYQPLTTNMSITDSMSYAWESVWQNDLFNWVDDAAIYTVVNNMTTLIQISSNSYLANYLTYIFLFTVIYVIVDIILGVFTMITHLFNKEPK